MSLVWFSSVPMYHTWGGLEEKIFGHQLFCSSACLWLNFVCSNFCIYFPPQQILSLQSLLIWTMVFVEKKTLFRDYSEEDLQRLVEAAIPKNTKKKATTFWVGVFKEFCQENNFNYYRSAGVQRGRVQQIPLSFLSRSSDKKRQVLQEPILPSSKNFNRMVCNCGHAQQ